MPEFKDTREFPVDDHLVRWIRARAEGLGWTCVEGTVFDAEGSVTSLIHVDGHVVGCRFTRDGDVVGLHVYCHLTEPVASLTTPVPDSVTSRALVEALACDLGLAL